MASTNNYDLLFGFMVNHGYQIENKDVPLIEKAIILNSEAFLNPPEIIKELADGTDAPYKVLAHYALNQLNTPTNSAMSDFDFCL